MHRSRRSLRAALASFVGFTQFIQRKGTTSFHKYIETLLGVALPLQLYAISGYNRRGPVSGSIERYNLKRAIKIMRI